MSNPKCAKRDCTDPRGSHTRDWCSRHYRQQIRMGLCGWRDASRARAHVHQLRRLGWTYVQIAEAAGTSTWVPHKLDTKATNHLWPESERAILALPLTPRPSHRGINSAGTRRRVQALAWMGWPTREVAHRAGVRERSLASLIQPTRQVSHALALRVAHVYNQLSDVPGPSRGARAKARQLDHAPPAAWDDDTIDDPKARPHGVRQTQQTVTQKGNPACAAPGNTVTKATHSPPKRTRTTPAATAAVSA